MHVENEWSRCSKDSRCVAEERGKCVEREISPKGVLTQQSRVKDSAEETLQMIVTECHNGPLYSQHQLKNTVKDSCQTTINIWLVKPPLNDRVMHKPSPCRWVGERKLHVKRGLAHAAL